MANLSANLEVLGVTIVDDVFQDAMLRPSFVESQVGDVIGSTLMVNKDLAAWLRPRNGK